VRPWCFPEPFKALFTQGMICKKSYVCYRCGKIASDDPTVHDPCRCNVGMPLAERLEKEVEVTGRLEKMSKSKGNVVSPDDLIRDYGADTLRLYTLFIGPPERDVEWSDRGIEGSARFLKRIWHRFYENQDLLRASKNLKCDLAKMTGKERDLYRKLHETIAHVTEDMDGAFHFNSAIAQIMELSNAMDEAAVTADSPEQHRAVYYASTEALILLLSPFSPHIAEELWAELGNSSSVLKAKWPDMNKAALARDEIEMVIQVNGKIRGWITVPVSLGKAELEARALADKEVMKFAEGKTVRKVVVVPGRLINIAVS